MTREETTKILAVIGATYPNFKPEDKTATVDAWHFMLSDYDYNMINIALKAYVTTSNTGFAPSVSQLIAMTHKADEFNQMNEVEAWSLVSSALRNSSYHAEEEFNKLPPVIQKCVGSPSQLRMWAQSDEQSIESVVASNFQRSYRVECERAKEYNRMPVEARALIGGVCERLRIQ